MLGESAAGLPAALPAQLLAENSARQLEIKAKEDEIRALRVRGLADRVPHA